MKKSTLQFYLLPLLGAVGFCLRRGLYAAAVDDKGLLTRMHPLTVALWLLTLAAAAAALIFVWKQSGSGEFGENFAPSYTAAAGHGILAVGILWSLIRGADGDFGGIKLLQLFGSALGWASAASLAWCGWLRLKNRKILWGMYGVVSAYFALELVSRYQGWSSMPQMMNYIFSLGTGLCLMIYFYQMSAMCAGVGKRRQLLFAALFGSFCGLTAVAYGAGRPLWLGGAVCMMTNLCRVSPEKE